MAAKKFPPPQFTVSWCKNQRALGKSMNQMAKVFSVSPRVIKRWLRNLGLSTNRPADPRRAQRHEAFAQALKYVDSLRVYPQDEELRKMVTTVFPFHINDLIEMIETRPFRNQLVIQKEK